MTDDLLILHASELVTLKGPRRARAKAEMSDLAIVRDGAVAISGGVIIDVGRTETILKEHEATGIETVDASGKVVMPGFVDPHSHLVYAGSREFETELKAKGMSYLEILEEGGGILRTMRDTRAASAEIPFPSVLSQAGINDFHGSTTIEAKSGYGLDRVVELRMLETIRKLGTDYPVTLVPPYLGAHAVPPEFKDSSDGYIEFIVDEVIPDVAKHRLAEF